MNSLDITILVLITVSILFGVARGLVREIFSLLALILGFLIAARFYVIPAAYMRQWITQEALASFIGFILIFLGVSITIGITGTLLRSFLKRANLDVQDRLLGGIFGFIKGLLIATVMVLILMAFMPPKQPFLSQSKLLPYFVRLGGLVVGVIPDALRDTVDRKKDDLVKLWEEQRAAPRET